MKALDEHKDGDFEVDPLANGQSGEVITQDRCDIIMVKFLMFC